MAWVCDSNTSPEAGAQSPNNGLDASDSNVGANPNIEVILSSFFSFLDDSGLCSNFTAAAGADIHEAGAKEEGIDEEEGTWGADGAT